MKTNIALLTFLTALLVPTDTQSCVKSSEDLGEYEFYQCTENRKLLIINKLQKQKKDALSDDELDQLVDDLDFTNIGLYCMNQLKESKNFQEYYKIKIS